MKSQSNRKIEKFQPRPDYSTKQEKSIYFKLVKKNALKNSYVRDFIDQCKKKKFSKHTIDLKTRNLGVFVEWLGDADMTKVSQGELNEFVKNFSGWNTDAETHKLKVSLRNFFRYLRRHNITKINWETIGLKYSQEDHIKPLTIEEFKQIDEICVRGCERKRKKYLRYRAMINVLWQTGIRRDELASIMVSDYDPKHSTIEFHNLKSKYYKKKKIYFDMKKYIRKYKPSGKLFKCCDTFVDRCIRDLLSESKIYNNISAASFRVGMVNHLYNKGFSLEFIADYIGLSSKDRVLDMVISPERKFIEYDTRLSEAFVE